MGGWVCGWMTYVSLASWSYLGLPLQDLAHSALGIQRLEEPVSKITWVVGGWAGGWMGGEVGWWVGGWAGGRTSKVWPSEPTAISPKYWALATSAMTMSPSPGSPLAVVPRGLYARGRCGA